MKRDDCVCGSPQPSPLAGGGCYNCGDGAVKSIGGAALPPKQSPAKGCAWSVLLGLAVASVFIAAFEAVIWTFGL